jgi:hypothetical protein
MTSSVEFRDLWWSSWKFKNLHLLPNLGTHTCHFESLETDDTSREVEDRRWLCLFDECCTTALASRKTMWVVALWEYTPITMRYSDILTWHYAGVVRSMPYVYWCALVWSSGRGDDMNWLVRKYVVFVCVALLNLMVHGTCMHPRPRGVIV